MATDTPTSSTPDELPIVDLESAAREGGQRADDRPTVDDASREADVEYVSADRQSPVADDRATTEIEWVDVDAGWVHTGQASITVDDGPAVVDDEDVAGSGESAEPRHLEVPQQAGGRHRRTDPPRPPWAARPRLLGAVALAVAVVAAGIALVVPSAFARLQDDQSAIQPANPATPPTSSPLAEPTPTRPAQAQQPTLAANPVAVDVDGFVSWALLDRAGRISGSANLATTTESESMVRIWVVSDYLRRLAAQGRQPTANRLAQARRVIRYADAEATQALYLAGGGAAQIRRMISVCDLSDTRADGSRWSNIRISARDAARLGGCVADGRAAGPSWTKWVRTEMTKVSGGTGKDGKPTGGRWGIVDGLPDQILAGVGIQNGWTAVWGDGQWHVNCLAVADEWSLAVLTRYSVDRGLRYGAQACAEVAAQLVTRTPPSS